MLRSLDSNILGGGVVGLMFCRISEGLLNPSDLKHTVPTFSSFAPTPLGLRHSPRTFVGIGSQQEVDFAREKKRELGVSVEGRSLDCTENIRGVCALARTACFLHREERDTARFQGGSLCTLLPQNEAVALS